MAANLTIQPPKADQAVITVNLPKDRLGEIVDGLHIGKWVYRNGQGRLFILGYSGALIDYYDREHDRIKILPEGTKLVLET